MEIRDDLPIPAYYELCDDILRRIDRIQFLEIHCEEVPNTDGLIKRVENRIMKECNNLRKEIEEIKRKLGDDSLTKIREDINKLHEVVLQRLTFT